ncbi:MAG: glycoside hydrolase family 27 protein, partial [Bacteroidales bacterium]
MIKTISKNLFIITGFLLSVSVYAQQNAAQRPPMGWNSFDCYGASVNEAEVRANADMMAAHLKDYRWEYIVVDYCWFFPYTGAMGDPAQDKNFKPSFNLDKYGRLHPAVDKFPSSAGGKGFKPLADYVHSKRLKFGIHVMRGIPRQAVAINHLVKGTGFRAKDICDQNSICRWLNAMYGVDMNKAGYQEYYNSLLELFALCGVDYIKVDDIANPYRVPEIEAIRKAIDKCGREIVLSLSPGETPLQTDAIIEINLGDVGLSASCQIVDLWNGTILGTYTTTFSKNLIPHGSG